LRDKAKKFVDTITRRTAALSLMTFCTKMYLDNLY